MVRNRAYDIFLSILMVFTIPHFSMGMANATGTCYSLTGTVITDGSGCSGDLVIDGSVTGIGQRPDGTGAFEANGGLTSVTIPGSVLQIGYGAFRSSGLLSITFTEGSSPVIIGSNAFDYLSQLRSVTLSSNVTTIGSGAFYRDRYLETLTIPQNVTSIDRTAFERSGMTSLIIQGTARALFNGAVNKSGITAYVAAGELSGFQSQNSTSGVTFQAGNGPPPVIFSPLSNSSFTGRVGRAFSSTMTYSASGNSVTSVSAGSSLPQGLSLNSSGLISGVPEESGLFVVALKVTDGSGVSTEVTNITFNIAAIFNGTVTLSTSHPVLSIANPSQISSFITNAPYDYQVYLFYKDFECYSDYEYHQANGGLVGNYYIFLNGFSSAYYDCGPSEYNFRIYDPEVQDIDSSTSFLASTTIILVAGSTEVPIITSPSNNSTANGFVGSAFSSTIEFNPGVGAQATTVTFGALPPGLTLDLSGHITGTPTTSGSYCLDITLTDSTNQTSTLSNLCIVISGASATLPVNRQTLIAQGRVSLFQKILDNTPLSVQDLIAADISVPSQTLLGKSNIRLQSMLANSPTQQTTLDLLTSLIAKESIVEDLSTRFTQSKILPSELVSAGFLESKNPNKTFILIQLKKLPTAKVDSIEKIENSIAELEKSIKVKKERLAKLKSRGR